MAKKWYAARHSHGLEFAYDGGGWTVYEFDSHADRERWVYETNTWDSRNGYNQRSEVIDRRIARLITGSRTRQSRDNVAELDGSIVGIALEYDGQSYYNPRYWG